MVLAALEEGLVVGVIGGGGGGVGVLGDVQLFGRHEVRGGAGEEGSVDDLVTCGGYF